MTASTPVTQSAEGAYEPIFVARQPIFTRDQSIWGYELLFRHAPGATTAQITDPNAATARIIADGFALASEGLATDLKLLINFPAALLLSESALALPPEVCVPEILETVTPEPAIVKACTRLKEAGYTLALDDYVGQPGYEPLLELADIIKVDVLGMQPPQIIALGQRLKKHKVMLLAEKVEDKAVFQLCQTVGYGLFQGYYFSKPLIIPGRTLSAGNVSKLQLLGKLARDDFSIKEVARAIAQDPSLGFRLLRHINSAAYQQQQKIDSIQQAVQVMGARNLRQWLLVATMSDMDAAPRAVEIFFSSVRRGKFLEAVHGEMSSPVLSRDSLFLMGVFSRLDALLGQPMEEILPLLGLNEHIERALLRQGGPGQSALALAEALDDADFDRADRLLLELGFSQDTTALRHAQACLWARTVLEGGEKGSGGTGVC